MFGLFRKTSPAKIRLAQYKRFTLNREFVDAKNRKETIAEILNLDEPELITNILEKIIQLDDQDLFLESYFLDYIKKQKGIADKLCSVCLISSTTKMNFSSLKIMRKLPQVLESLGASSTGGIIANYQDDEFDSKVTVYARNAKEAEILNPKSREIVLKSLYERNLSPMLRIGEHFMLFETESSFEEPTDLIQLEKLMTDLLSLYACFSDFETNHGDKDA